jgi:DNA-binding NarL/FixJ family response regulator
LIAAATPREGLGLPIRVLIADDHVLVRSGLKALLDRTPDIQTVAEASDGHEALALITTHRPYVVLMDLTMAGLNGLEATLRTVREHSGVRVIVLSMHKQEEYIVQALQAGASGYLVKDAAASELLTAIRTVVSGATYLSPTAAQRVAEYQERFGALSARDVPPQRLTQREREVLQLIVEGRTMQEIAGLLGISPKTVETHRYRVMDRLNIHHITGLVRYAVRIGLVQPE